MLRKVFKLVRVSWWSCVQSPVCADSLKAYSPLEKIWVYFLHCLNLNFMFKNQSGQTGSVPDVSVHPCNDSDTEVRCFNPAGANRNCALGQDTPPFSVGGSWVVKQMEKHYENVTIYPSQQKHKAASCWEIKCLVKRCFALGRDKTLHLHFYYSFIQSFKQTTFNLFHQS